MILRGVGVLVLSFALAGCAGTPLRSKPGAFDARRMRVPYLKRELPVTYVKPVVDRHPGTAFLLDQEVVRRRQLLVEIAIDPAAVDEIAPEAGEAAHHASSARAMASAI